MKTLLLLGAAVMVAVIVALAVLASKSRQMPPPSGLVNGRLAPCPTRPNCVCSEAGEDAAHAIAPLPAKTWPELPAAIERLGGRIGQRGARWLHATFATPLFGFVDDIEARLDPAAGVVHLRSASRVGHSDLGANRRRIEALRARLIGKR